jgi:hypothetical protein
LLTIVVCPGFRFRHYKGYVPSAFQ